MGCGGTGSRTTCRTCQTPPSTPSWAVPPHQPMAARPSPDRYRPVEDDIRRTSTRLYAGQIAPYGRGVYVNNLGIEGEDRVRDAYGAQKFERLTRLKARFDPDNVFRLNQNICPATTSAGRPR